MTLEQYTVKELTDMNKINIVRILMQLRDNAFVNLLMRNVAKGIPLEHVVSPACRWIIDHWYYIESREEFDKIMIDLICSVGIKDLEDAENKDEFECLLKYALDCNGVSLLASKKNFKINRLLDACCDVLASVYYDEVEVPNNADLVLKELYEQGQGKVFLGMYLFRRISG